jgi:hypothetical protein
MNWRPPDAAENVRTNRTVLAAELNSGEISPAGMIEGRGNKL